MEYLAQNLLEIFMLWWLVLLQCVPVYVHSEQSGGGNLLRYSVGAQCALLRSMRSRVSFVWVAAVDIVMWCLILWDVQGQSVTLRDELSNWHFILLKPTGHVMHQQFNIQQLYVLHTHCIYVFCIYLRTNSDLCHLQHKLIGFYNRDEKCLLRGTDWAFN